MRITVLCFAELAEALGTTEFTLELPDGTDVEAAMDAVCAGHPSVTERRDTLAIAVNERYASGAQTLQDGDVMAMVGPVSGG